MAIPTSESEDTCSDSSTLNCEIDNLCRRTILLNSTTTPKIWQHHKSFNDKGWLGHELVENM